MKNKKPFQDFFLERAYKNNTYFNFLYYLILFLYTPSERFKRQLHKLNNKLRRFNCIELALFAIILSFYIISVFYNKLAKMPHL